VILFGDPARGAPVPAALSTRPVGGPDLHRRRGLLVAAGLIGWPAAYAVAVTADLTGDTLYYLLSQSARHPRAGDAPRWLQAVRLRQGHVRVCRRGLHRCQARDGETRLGALRCRQRLGLGAETAVDFRRRAAAAKLGPILRRIGPPTFKSGRCWFRTSGLCRVKAKRQCYGGSWVVRKPQ
jgi:hypothetical protein